MTGVPSPGDSSETAGMALVRLRRAAGLTGQQLGQLVRMSQAKISRIETGQTAVSPADAGRLARALGAAPEEAERVVGLAQRAHNQMTDWRQNSDVIGGIQVETLALEAEARVVRIFQPNVIVGLAQTAEYAGAVLSSLQAVYGADDDRPARVSVARAVTARIARQEVLVQPGRQFHFLMGEGALAGLLVSPAQMLAQIDRLRKLARQDNVVLRLIPSDGRLELPLPLIHGFELLDDSAVFVDIFNTAMISRGAKDLARYRAVFERLEAVAPPDPEPLLLKYREFYLRDLIRDGGAAG